MPSLESSFSTLKSADTTSITSTMSFLPGYCLLGLFLLVTVSTARTISKTKDRESGTLASIKRSCGVGNGSVCIPTACDMNACSLFKDAVCVPDQCGCEARFFNWNDKEKTYQSVSEMCWSANFVVSKW